ncbi:MAG: hypothetical protein R3314_10850, partial [Longimicrobiales bacterium]|nr:hypothetical protein [Longimicrobiales bacterium]
MPDATRGSTRPRSAHAGRPPSPLPSPRPALPDTRPNPLHPAGVLTAALLLLVLIAGGPAGAAAQGVTTDRPFGTLREQAAVQQTWLRLRL